MHNQTPGCDAEHPAVRLPFLLLRYPAPAQRHPVIALPRVEVEMSEKKKATKADLKRVKKAIAEKRRSGIEVYTDEELDAAGLRAPFSPYD